MSHTISIHHKSMSAELISDHADPVAAVQHMLRDFLKPDRFSDHQSGLNRYVDFLWSEIDRAGLDIRIHPITLTFVAKDDVTADLCRLTFPGAFVEVAA